MKKKLIFLSLLTLIVAACGGSNKNGNDAPSDSITVVRNIGGSASQKCGGVPSKEIKNATSTTYDNTFQNPTFINAYIDASGSMKGYFSKNSDGRFITAISNANPEKLMWMDNKFTELKGIPTNQLLTGNFSGGDSDFSTMFDRIISRDDLCNSNGVSLLFTDGIISASSADTKKNSEYIHQSIGYLKNAISDTLRKREGISVAILMLNSKYNGTYWDYRNIQVPNLTVEDRPFYIIAIGKPACIRYFMKNNSINATLAEAFGIYDAKKDNEKGTLFVPTRYTDWNGNKFIGQELALNLQLPEYIAELGKEYILKNMVVEYNGKNITDILLKDTTNNTIKINGKSFTINNWKTMDPKMPLIKAGENTLKIVIKKAKNTSWESYFSMDDKEIKTTLFEKGKTFALQYLIEGIKNGVEPDEVILFSSEIKFNK